MFKAKHINVGLTYGGLGDAIARAPAIKAFLEDYSHIEVTLFVFPSVIELYTEWFMTNRQVRGIYPLDEYKNLAAGELILNFDHSWYFQLGMHLTTHAYLTLALTMPSRRMPYLSLSDSDPVSYKTSNLVCITPNFTAISRSLAPNVWQGIIRGIQELGLIPVLLGSTKSEFKGEAYVNAEPGCIDLRDKTTLLEAVAWMEKSIAVIGIDNGLIHLAACTKTPIIVAYSTQIPENRLPVRDEGSISYIVASSECRGCETWLRFENEHNFKNCYTNSFDCVKSFSVASFINPLKELL